MTPIVQSHLENVDRRILDNRRRQTVLYTDNSLAEESLSQLKPTSLDLYFEIVTTQIISPSSNSKKCSISTLSISFITRYDWIRSPLSCLFARDDVCNSASLCWKGIQVSPKITVLPSGTVPNSKLSGGNRYSTSPVASRS